MYDLTEIITPPYRLLKLIFYYYSKICSQQYKLPPDYMMLTYNKIKLFVYIFLFCGSILLFIDLPYQYVSRFIYEFIDFIHIIFFALIILVLMKEWKGFEKLSSSYQIVFVILFTLILSILIEGIQYLLNRTADIGDINRNFIGCFFSIFFLWNGAKVNKYFIYPARIVVIVMIMMAFIPVVKALADETIARYQFPMLSNLETPFEIDRWRGRQCQYQSSKEQPRNGDKSLKVELHPVLYAGIWLDYFPPDWSHYKYLRLSIYNAEKESWTLYCRIHDGIHIETGEKYSDRYNTRFVLSSGWNEISLSLEEIRIAPRERMMDLTDIVGLGFFIGKQKTSRKIYIDNVRLEN